MLKEVKCPDCGEQINSTFEYMYAWANTNGIFYDDEEDVLTYEHTGYTDVMYDTQETLGVGCEHCGWTDVRTHMLTVKNDRSVMLVVPGDSLSPIIITFDLDEMDGPQTFIIDPDKGAIIPTEALPQEAS